MPSSKLSRAKSKEIRSRSYIVLMQINVGIGWMSLGVLFTQINILTEHLSHYYGWTDETKIQKIILLSNTLSFSGLLMTPITPYILARGRKFTCIIYLFLIFIGSGIQLMSKEQYLFIGRAFQGLGFGIYGSVATIYLKEMSPPEMVGSGNAISSCIFSFGKLSLSLFGLFLGPPDDSSSLFIMKLIIAYPMLLCLINFICFTFCCKYKTPKYLMSQRKLEEAERSLSKIYSQEYISQKSMDLQKDLKEVKDNTTYTDVFTIYWKPFAICLFVSIMFNTSGTMALQLYSNQIFLEKVSLKVATICTNVLFAFSLAGTIISIKIYDFYGNKEILQASYIALSLCLGLFSVFSMFEDMVFFWLNAVILWIVMFIWGICMTASWIIFADYLPDKAIGLVYLAMNSLRVIQGILIPLGNRSILKSSGTFLILSMCQLIGYLILDKYLIESKGSTHNILWKKLGVKLNIQENPKTKLKQKNQKDKDKKPRRYQCSRLVKRPQIVMLEKPANNFSDTESGSGDD